MGAPAILALTPIRPGLVLCVSRECLPLVHLLALPATRHAAVLLYLLGAYLVFSSLAAAGILGMAFGWTATAPGRFC